MGCRAIRAWIEERFAFSLRNLFAITVSRRRSAASWK